MEGNPYREIVSAMSEQIDRAAFWPIITGVVITPLPLTVAAGGVTLSAANGLLVAAELTNIPQKIRVANPEAALEIEVKGAANGTLSIEEEKLNAELQAVKAEPLKAGDRVLLATADRNIYIVLCKVVAAV